MSELKPHRVTVRPHPISDTIALECSCGWRQVHGDHREGDFEKARQIAEEHAALPPYEVKPLPQWTDFSNLLKP